jgi:hypothetical protein
MAPENTNSRLHAAPNRKFNVDLLAIGIALTLAALIRLNILPHIGF